MYVYMNYKVFQNYVLVNIVVVFSFALMYHFTDLTSKTKSETEKYTIGTMDHLYRFIDDIHFSLVTQTTVGYTHHFFDSYYIHSITYKIINVLQLISIFIINAYFLSK